MAFHSSIKKTTLQPLLTLTLSSLWPKNAGLHYSLALGMVSNMESLSSMVTIKQTTSEDEAKAMLDSGEVKAAVIIPEGMIHTIMSGTNDLPARIIYPGEPSIETVIFRQIVDSLSQMVARLSNWSLCAV